MFDSKRKFTLIELLVIITTTTPPNDRAYYTPSF